MLRDLGFLSWFGFIALAFWGGCTKNAPGGGTLPDGGLDAQAKDAGDAGDTLCGNGMVDEGETCDIGIVAGDPGACPTTCDTTEPCETVFLSGRDCQAHCVVGHITNNIDHDGCCPPGSDRTLDSDCAIQCGNGAVEPGETCDPPSSCPTSCDDDDACTIDMMTGSAETCDATCTHEPITSCTNGDGCCPVRCDAVSDSDCSAVCPNGVVEQGETCDPPSSCPTSCDDGDVCTMDRMAGSAETCSATCINQPITTCTDGDGCCPSTCNSLNDDDCTAECSNGVVEQGETCDPPSSCPTDCDDGDVCTADTMTGSSQNCNVACQHQTIATCTNGDGCCPSTCNSLNDTDCSPDCGNGVVEQGETCDPPSSCPTDCDDGDVCTTDTMTGSAQNCDVACQNQAITTCTNGDGCCPSGCDAVTDTDCSSVCGNNVVEPGEQCDDGNVTPGDGCDGNCQNEGPVVTAFRIDWMELRDPHIFLRILFSCYDVTDSAPFGQQSVNEQLNDDIQNDVDGDGYLELSLLFLIRPLDQSSSYSGPVDIGNALCTSPMSTTTCDVDPTAPMESTTYANQGSGTCLSPYAGTTSGYSPGITEPTAPPVCYITGGTTITLMLGGTPVTFHDARLAAVYSGDPATSMIDGVIAEFITETDAQNTMLDLGALGTKSLSDLLQPDACGAGDDMDVGLDGSTPGWWFYLNFTAVPVTWVGQ